MLMAVRGEKTENSVPCFPDTVRLLANTESHSSPAAIGEAGWKEKEEANSKTEKQSKSWGKERTRLTPFQSSASVLEPSFPLYTPLLFLSP